MRIQSVALSKINRVNNKISKKDNYIIQTLKGLIDKGIKSLIEYEKHIEVYKSENKTKATKKNKTENKSDNTSKKLNPKVHNFPGSANFMKYEADELEKKLLESQKEKFGW